MCTALVIFTSGLLLVIAAVVVIARDFYKQGY